MNKDEDDAGDGCPHCGEHGCVEVALAADADSIVTCRECGGSGRRQPGCLAPTDRRLSYGYYCEAQRRLLAQYPEGAPFVPTNVADLRARMLPG
ncbi:hypothetical protein ACFVXQ_01090 [Kitasatospora sp. NPDC058263]